MFGELPCQNFPETDPTCWYVQSWLSRNLGKAGEHCTFPNNPVLTSQVQRLL